MLKSNKGFTLIEAVVSMALLSVVVLSSFRCIGLYYRSYANRNFYIRYLDFVDNVVELRLSDPSFYLNVVEYFAIPEGCYSFKYVDTNNDEYFYDIYYDSNFNFSTSSNAQYIFHINIRIIENYKNYHINLSVFGELYASKGVYLDIDNAYMEKYRVKK